MFRISSILTCAALALSLGAALTGPAAAQAQAVTVNIPFDFSANDQMVPAGRYRISLQAPRYLSFVDTQATKRQYLMLVQPTGEQNSKDLGRLIFRCYGDSNYLYQVWMPGQGEGRQFVRSRTEQETLERKSSSLAYVQLPTGPAQQ
ncbi:hypothetical protein [Edaphobacter modestus]|uniref:Uncharacterized protein n=1 Tax=Edaphobacter modestus TaxID=388466 RepID=A0A4Q7Z1Q0_9BACT|nr:hypothetical protein [Edaphobacter modestus]RZU43455.1 hypothetical protein BDD14_5119 [Edaphobacter modestus]